MLTSVVIPFVFTFLTIIQTPTGTPGEIITEIEGLLAMPETAGRMMRVEILLTHLQRGGDPSRVILEPRIEAHAKMLTRYRAAGLTPGIVTHANWLISAEGQVKPGVALPAPVARVRAGNFDDVERRRALRAKFAAVFIDAYLTMARVVNEAGDRDKAIWWLQTGERRMYDVAEARKALRAEIQRIKGSGAARAVDRRPRG